MGYQVLARKWRPQTFSEMVGQEHVTRTLANALDKDRVAHAYLLAGPRGCGKTTMARLLAKALNCDEGPTSTPCAKCESCLGIAAGNYLDVLEIDAASNTGVDNIRELRENVQYQPQAGKRRVFIIDEVHMLSKGAFNALLKTLEEPPSHVHFIFATTEPSRLPQTILSRCQRFDFRLFRLEELVARLGEIAAEEKFEITTAALELLASMAEGSMRDALSLFDQAVSSSDGSLDEGGVLALYGLVGHDSYLRLNELILEHDAAGALDLVDELSRAGHDLVEFARGLVQNFRDLLLLSIDPRLAARIEKPESAKQQLVEQAARFEAADLLHLTQRAAEHYMTLERAPQPRWLLEAQVVEYAQSESRVLLSDLLGRVEALASGQPMAPAKKATPKAVTQRKVAPAPPRNADVATTVKPPAEAATEAELPPIEEPMEERSAEPAARTAAAATSDALHDPSLAGAYQQLLERVRSADMATGTCLLEASPRIDGNILVLIFKAQHAFHRDQVARSDSLRRLSEVASECFGRPMKVEAKTADPEPHEEELRRGIAAKVAPTQRQQLERAKESEPGLDRLVEGLGGEIVGGE